MNKIMCVGVILSLGLLTACATQTTIEPVINAPVVTEPEPEPESQQPVGPITSATTNTFGVNPQPPISLGIATESLAALARSQYQTRQYQSAIATAERGLRIDRRTASLYLVLAQSYIQLEMPQKARNFVQQGLRYATQDSDVEISLLRVRDILGE